uniref:Myomesin 2a n=1 Tax=Paramormyrops kingsleyae TaxID=1676925 RepID=A0A3B3SBK7_9TELE
THHQSIPIKRKFTSVLSKIRHMRELGAGVCITRDAAEVEEYQRRTINFGRGLAELQQEVHKMREATRYQVERIVVQREVEEAMSFRKKIYEETVKEPEFLVNVRAHTVWEKTPLKLLCTVLGHPAPIVKWFKNGVLIDRLNNPDKYKLESKYGVHSLTIARSDIGDTGEYTAVATNVHGSVSSKATVTNVLNLILFHFCSTVPLLSEIRYSKLDITFLEKFGVTFGTEGGTVSLTCKLIINPDLVNLPPDAMWYRDDELLKESEWVELKCGGSVAKLTLPHLNKEDEGLYTLRMWTKEGTTEHSAYLFVKDAAAPVAGAPPAPMDVKILDVNRDYVFLSWKPPNTTTEGPITGYFVDRLEVGTETWVQCNSAPVKICRYPVPGLSEGHAYQFRVRAANSSGISHPSRVSETVTTQDPTELERLQGVPSAPGQVAATRNTKTSVFVQWDPPKNPHGLIGYYIDGCVLGTKAWTPCNHRPYKYTRFVVHGLTPGDTYVFRVQAVNAFGLSDESQESLPIQVADALSTPTPAYGIALLCCDGASMILGWKRPRYSGGSKIAGYYVDQHEASSMEWKEVNVVPVKERTLKVENLKEGAFYEFKVKAANLAGVGQSSENSELFHCEAWNMPEPGPCHDISFCEIRNDSLVVQWKPPVYMGKSAVTGYLIEVSKKGTGQWAAVNDKSVDHCYLKVSELEKGETYVFRVRAVNAQGIGRASDASEPVCVKALPGTKEIHCGVDEETGDVYLSFEACEVSEVSKFIWSKSYKDITNSSRVTIETKGRRSKLIFKNPDKEDLGTYSVFVTDTENVSASTVLKEEELNKMLELSYAIRHPIVPLKTELAYEVLERGRVRFWLQAARMSPAVSYRFIANDKQITTSEGYKLSHNVETGIIELMMERFTKESEGTYTIQIEDGKAKNQSSLLLIGDAFKVALKEAEFQRKEYIRKQGPHFQDYLYFQVEEDCTVLLKCKLANVKKETVFHWYKDDEEIVLDTPVNVMSGSCALPIPLFSRKDQGIYKATLSDDRGKDVSLFDISGKVFEDIINGIAHIAGSSASELVLQCTPEGIRLQCYMKYYTEEMKTHWFHKESKISSSEKMRIGGTSEMAWMQICEPSDREKGHYTIEILDGTTSHTRTFDLSGQVKPLCCLFAYSDRGRVVGGLPDVVTIMEKKTLSLTCTIWGDPTPEVTWFKNEQEVIPDDHILISFEGGKFSSLTIKCVTSEDSGKYSINVRNKYGGEFVEITVSVYRQGEEIPEPKLGQRPGGASPMPPPQSAKSPTPTPSVKSPTPSSGARSPTPRQEAKSPTPPRNVKSPTPPRRK